MINSKISNPSKCVQPPRLMISTLNNIIVLDIGRTSSNTFKGVVVHLPNDYKSYLTIGDIYDSFSIDNFKLFDGEVSLSNPI